MNSNITYDSIGKKLWKKITTEPSYNALVFKNKEGKWKTISSVKMAEMIMSAACALIRFAKEKGCRIVIFSQNMPEWTIADYAIQFVRGISVPVYPTLTTTQASYIINETESIVLFVGEQDQYDKAIEVAASCPFVKKVIAFDDDVMLRDRSLSVHFRDFISQGVNRVIMDFILSRMDEITPDDLLTILYTSGTTGEPKGVMLKHSAFTQVVKIHDMRLSMVKKDRSLCFLPLSHIFERGWSTLILQKGIINFYLKNPKEIIDVIREVKPTLMCTVPRFFEKTYTAVFNEVDSFSQNKKKLFLWAVKTGTSFSEKKRLSKKIPLLLRIKYFLANIFILKKGRAVLGGRIRYMPCAGASLSDVINKFFHAVGLDIKYGYGLSETTATVSCFTEKDFVYGSVGKIMPEVEVKIGENNEIMVKGKTVMAGYYKKQKETDEVLEDGWLKTGDAGWIDNKGNLYITERIKDIIKTSSGKYIAPQYVEAVTGNDPYINQIVVIGDNKNYITALVIPVFNKLIEFAGKSGISYTDMKDLISKQEIIDLIMSRINRLQKDLVPFEQIKKVRLTNNEFSQETGELTSTLKLKRKFIAEKYKDLIESMY